MKLKNKKTGEIATLTLSSNGEDLLLMKNNEMVTRNVKLSDLEEWEDYEEPKDYWRISLVGADVDCVEDVKDEIDQYNKEIGNYFETKEEAEKAVEKLKAWKRLKDEGFRFTGVEEVERTIRFEIPYRTGYDSCEAEADLDLLFSGEATNGKI